MSSYLRKIASSIPSVISLISIFSFILPANATATATTYCNILALSGGGAFGAVEVGIVDALVSTKRIPPLFDVITGISAGGLNAGVFSYYNDIVTALPTLINMYSTITTQDVYYSDMRNLFSRWSIYNNAPLEKTMTTLLQSLPLPKYPPIVLIGATNVYTEELDIFMLNSLPLPEKIDVLMSTTAIPLIFPPRMYNHSLYIDGGIISNEIIYQATGFIDCAFYNITFIAARALHGTNNITGFTSYLSAVLHTVFTTFDSQLAQVTTCRYPKGQINACFPTDPQLETYSVLDFNHGKSLYLSGRNNHTCITYDLC